MLSFNEDNFTKPRPYIFYGFLLFLVLAAIVLIPLSK